MNENPVLTNINCFKEPVIIVNLGYYEHFFLDPLSLL